MTRIRSHPGEILLNEYLFPLNISAAKLAAAINVPANRLTDIVRGRRGVTADTALRLGRYFDTDPRFWLNLQQSYDLSKAQAAIDLTKVPRRAA